MSDYVSYLKARYCFAVLRTATLSPLEEARHLIRWLSTEVPTLGASRAVTIVERNALAAIMTLHERFVDRSVAAVASEWKSASEAVREWVDIAKAEADV
jgi:hypothetical protein